MVGLDVRHLGGVGHQKVHERGIEQLPSVVIDHPLVQGPTHALRDTAVHLTLDDHRVDHPAAVMDHAVTENLYLGGHWVGLDDGRVHAVGERRLCRGVVALALEPRLLAVGHRRLGIVHRPGVRELCCGLGGLVEGVAQRVGHHGNSCQGDRGLRITLDPYDAVDDLQVTGIHLERVAGDTQGLLPDVSSRERDRVAAHHGGTRGECAYGVGESAGVTGRDEDILDRNPELVSDDLGEHRLMPLALAGQAGRDVDAATCLDLDVSAFIGTDAGSLDIATYPEPDPATLGRGLGAIGSEVVPAHQLLELGQTGREVAGVVHQRSAVLEEQSVVVGHVLHLDEVGAAHIGAVETEIVRDRVHRALHREDTLRPTRTAVGGDHDGVGVHREELDPVGAGFVGPEQLGRGDDRHDDPVWRVGTVVVPELHRKAEHPSGVIEPDLDVL